MKICISCKETKTLMDFYLVHNKYYRKDCKKCINKKASFRQKSRRSKDMQYVLRGRLSARLRAALKQRKSKSIVKYIGCSLEQLKKHIEEQFKNGMSWDNRNLWHIDHIIPISHFDLTNASEIEKANHYTNLQPLWVTENLKKGAKYD